MMSSPKKATMHIDREEEKKQAQAYLEEVKSYPEEEKVELQRLYLELIGKAHGDSTEGEKDVEAVKRAFWLSVEAHKDMRRRSGEAFVFHPISVAFIVVNEIGLGTTSIVAALLHDVVEDTEYTLEDIERLFDKTVAEIIDGLTKMKATERRHFANSMQAENFKKMLVTISKDIRVVLIKIADRLHNMRTLDSMERGKQLRIRSETSYIYAPLAHRLGLYNIKTELEDLGLKYSDPKSFYAIEKKIEESKPSRSRFFDQFIRPVKKELDKKKKQHPGWDYEVKQRVKSVYSIYQKMQKQQIPFEQVYDFFAFRIIITGDISDEKLACWEVYSIVTDNYTPNTRRLRDWVSVPRENGYESLHITVMGPKGQWVEVQIRTERMDEVAERGFAAHWRYKDSKSKGRGSGKKKAEQGLEDWIARVRELLEHKNLDAIEFVTDFKSNLYKKEVYVFTPKGDLKRFPNNATVLDFAFDVHTEVGLYCMGAKVNGRLVPLHQLLQNGDQVEILTSNKQVKVGQNWLQYAETSKARSKIKEYLKEDEKRISEMGREVVARKFKQMKEPLDDKNAIRIAKFFNQPTETDFYYQVGLGNIDHTQIKKFKEHLLEEEGSKRVKADTSKDFKKSIKELKESNNELVIGENTDGLDYSLAQCCKPVPGDGIYGFITINSGIKVHRTTCPNAISMLANYGHRVINARWSSTYDKEFEVNMIIEGTDRMGLVNDVTKVISNKMQVNIKSINIGTDTGIFQGKISLSVHGGNEIQALLDKLEKIDGVLKITREEEKV